MALLGVSPLGVRLFTGPLLLAHRLSGYVPEAFRYPYEGEVPMEYEDLFLLRTVLLQSICHSLFQIHHLP